MACSNVLSVIRRSDLFCAMNLVTFSQFISFYLFIVSFIEASSSQDVNVKVNQGTLLGVSWTMKSALVQELKFQFEFLISLKYSPKRRVFRSTLIWVFRMRNQRLVSIASSHQKLQNHLIELITRGITNRSVHNSRTLKMVLRVATGSSLKIVFTWIFGCRKLQ